MYTCHIKIWFSLGNPSQYPLCPQKLLVHISIRAVIPRYGIWFPVENGMENQGLTRLCNTPEHGAWHTCWITLPNAKGTFLLLNFSGAFDSREATDHFFPLKSCSVFASVPHTILLLLCFSRSLAIPFKSFLQSLF